jgi:hypothetical protein
MSTSSLNNHHDHVPLGPLDRQSAAFPEGVPDRPAPAVPRQPTFWERFSFRECVRWAAFFYLCLWATAVTAQAWGLIG